jgi:hypothetical protein
MPETGPCMRDGVGLRATMGLIHLVYVSSASQPFSSDELVALLDQARRKNASLGVTGLLLYRDGNFMQVLEGEQDAVTKIHGSIVSDRRHRGLITLIQGPIAERAFSAWSMAFRDLNSAETRALPGYSEYLNEDWFGAPLQKNPDRALRLLHGFRQGMK